MNAEYHNPDGLTDEQVGVKDGWRLCLKTETEHEGCEWFSPGRNRWASNYLYEGCVLDPGYTYRTRRPLPDSSTEPKEGGDALWSQNAGTVVSATDPTKLAPSNAAAGTSNPFQQAAPSRQESAGGNGQAWVLFGREDELELYEYARVPVGDRAALLHAVKAAVWDMPENANEEEAQHITDRLIAEGIYRFEGDPALELETVPPYSMPTAPAVAEQELLPCPFCGQMPNVEECEEGQGVYVWCETKECPMHGLSPSRDKWNRRPAAPVAVGETPAVCQICGFPNRSAYGATIECGCKKPSSTGETPETDALEKETMAGRETHWLQVFATYQKLLKFARNLERQLAAARRERDEARAELNERRRLMEQNGMTEALRKAQEEISRETRCRAENQDALRALAAERDELMRRFTVIGRLIRKALPNICNPEGFPYERTLGIIREHRNLIVERDRLREENKTLKETRQRTVEELVKTRPYLTLMSECNNLKSALATAQADIAKLCSVIAAAFAETAKPLNASIEYDARPTEWERLKKVQEILASAIDAADHGARDYQAAQAEAAADKRRLDYMLSLSIQLNGLKYGNFYLAETREGIDAALDAASATEGGQG